MVVNDIIRMSRKGLVKLITLVWLLWWSKNSNEHNSVGSSCCIAYDVRWLLWHFSIIFYIGGWVNVAYKAFVSHALHVLKASHLQCILRIHPQLKMNPQNRQSILLYYKQKSKSLVIGTKPTCIWYMPAAKERELWIVIHNVHAHLHKYLKSIII